MRGSRRYESALQHTGRIGFAAGGSNTVAKHAACERAAFLRSLVLTSGFQSFERSQDFERLNLVDGSVPDGGRKLVEKIVGLDDRALGAAILDHHLFNILTCDCLERLCRKKLCADFPLPLLKGRVAPRSNSSSCLVGRVSRLLEADVGIAADAELLLRAADPVSESPKFAAGWRDLNI